MVQYTTGDTGDGSLSVLSLMAYLKDISSGRIMCVCVWVGGITLLFFHQL